MAELEVRNLYAGYQRQADVLKDVSFQLDPGATLLITGKNGTGKTTLLWVLAGLMPHRKGTIHWGGQSSVVNRYHGQSVFPWVGFLLQTDLVFPSLTVSENLKLAAGNSGISGRKLREHCIQKFPLMESLWHKRAGLLSGGQRKMVALAMVMHSMASLYILDEPLAGLNEENQNFVLGFLKENREKGIAQILVEHSSLEILNPWVDQRAMMEDGKLRFLSPSGPDETME